MSFLFKYEVLSICSNKEEEYENYTNFINSSVWTFIRNEVALDREGTRVYNSIDNSRVQTGGMGLEVAMLEVISLNFHSCPDFTGLHTHAIRKCMGFALH